MTVKDFKELASKDPIAWCPGCGNFGIMAAVQKAVVLLEKDPRDILLVSGIGQAAKLPHYLNANCFNGLHGRALPAATAARIVNRKLTVIVTTGDGDCYGEGGNHFLHAVRRNIDITVIVSDNQIYGLTKGQASPTTEPGFVTKVQPDGVINAAFHPLETAIVLGAGFVARGFARDQDTLAAIIAEAVRHKGFSLVDVFSPCISFNKKNTYKWYGERVYNLQDVPGYDPADRQAALAKAAESGDRIPLGIIYRKSGPSYTELAGLEEKTPLVELPATAVDIRESLEEYTA
ncbi:MAG: 2-oxoacid:ferredoxin oxidoreductase subunit beta [Spirochaetaceae bacterium]|nr:MAG: 2-oxoacid:ferredoxin oxidoreductase subunit beta [Spirochaetaceae bacterium]